MNGPFLAHVQVPGCKSDLSLAVASFSIYLFRYLMSSFSILVGILNLVNKYLIKINIYV
jgi:hypothetical protein